MNLFASMLASVAIVTDASSEAAPPPPLPNTQTTPEKMAETRKLVEAMERDAPLERKTIWYIEIAPGKYAPAYIDHHNRKEYRWRGVVLTETQIPTFEGASNPFIRGVYPTPPTGYVVEEMSPTVWYLPLGNGVYAPAYFDRFNGLVYRWQNVQVRESQLPGNAHADELILPNGMFVSWINPPGTELPFWESLNAPGNAGNTMAPPSTANAASEPKSSVPLASSDSFAWYLALALLPLVFAAALLYGRRSRAPGVND